MPTLLSFTNALTCSTSQKRGVPIPLTKKAQDCLKFLIPWLKARCTGFDRVSGWLDRDAGGNQAICVDNRKPFGIFTALQIERLDRLVVSAIDMNYLTRI